MIRKLNGPNPPRIEHRTPQQTFQFKSGLEKSSNPPRPRPPPGWGEGGIMRG